MVLRPVEPSRKRINPGLSTEIGEGSCCDGEGCRLAPLQKTRLQPVEYFEITNYGDSALIFTAPTDIRKGEDRRGGRNPARLMPGRNRTKGRNPNLTGVRWRFDSGSTHTSTHIFVCGGGSVPLFLLVINSASKISSRWSRGIESLCLIA